MSFPSKEKSAGDTFAIPIIPHGANRPRSFSGVAATRPVLRFAAELRLPQGPDAVCSAKTPRTAPQDPLPALLHERLRIQWLVTIRSCGQSHLDRKSGEEG